MTRKKKQKQKQNVWSTQNKDPTLIHLSVKEGVGYHPQIFKMNLDMLFILTLMFRLEPHLNIDIN